MISNYSNNSNSPSFQGLRKKTLLASVTVAAALIGGATHAYLKDPFLSESTGHESVISQKNDWGADTRILAAVGQNSITASNENDSYSKYLADMLDKKEIRTLEQANDMLDKKGYKIKSSDNLWQNIFSFGMNYFSNEKPFHSISTQGKRIHVFDKHDTTKTRFALFCSLADTNANFEAEADEFAEKVQQKYKIPDSNIVKISTQKGEDFVNSIDSIVAKINKIENKKNVELMLYYNGHGGVKSLIGGNQRVEGSLEGVILKTLSKSKTKKVFKEKLNGIKTLFILDACHSGAWISSLTPPKTATKMLLG